MQKILVSRLAVCTVIYVGAFLQMMWHGVLHHVRNQHSWATGCCDHEPLDESSQNKPWIQEGLNNFSHLMFICSAIVIFTLFDMWLQVQQLIRHLQQSCLTSAGWARWRSSSTSGMHQLSCNYKCTKV